MLIVADENIPLVRDAFERLGTVETLPGRTITRHHIRDADILLVRSVTRVDRSLLEGTRVKFVGTATIGTDHIDVEYLQKAGVGFASAAGSNANSVAEYVVAALLYLAERMHLHLREKTLGIVGVGNIGSRVVCYATEALSMKVLLNDPPLQRQTGRTDFVSLQTVLREADIVTLHVPLTRHGPDRTYHLISDAELTAMSAAGRRILINTSRGPVVDNDALKKALAAGSLQATVLDVWEKEPDIDADLLKLVTVATPHIAGYSLDGKVAGTKMLFDAVCRFFGITDTWDPTPLLPQPERPALTLEPTASVQADLHRLIASVYDIAADDARTRPLADLPPGQRGRYFDSLRKNYPVRREFFNYAVRLTRPAPDLERRIRALGFNLAV